MKKGEEKKKQRNKQSWKERRGRHKRDKQIPTQETQQRSRSKQNKTKREN